MTRPALLLAALTLAAPTAPATAQEGWGISADIGLGAEVEPDWLGAEDMETSPWLIFRNFDVTPPGEAAATDGSSQGLSVGPSFKWRGGRDEDDGEALAGLGDIDGTAELGVRARYTQGPVSGYVTLRKGFGGHDGWAGQVGAKYRIAPTERLTLWPGIEGQFGDRDFTRTYFGVSDTQAARSGSAAYDPDGGFYAAALTLEARYALTPSLALVGEAEYGKLVGDAADAPFIEDDKQTALRLGIVHRFNLRF